MIAILSPAKTFASKPYSPVSTPAPFAYAMQPIVEHALSMDQDTLGTILKLSPKLREEARRKWMQLLAGTSPLAPCLTYYSGMVFKKIDAKTFDNNDWAFADEHLRVCSFVYGLLHPSSTIRPYRMEGSVRLHDGLRIFDYWKPILTDHLIADCKTQGGILINIASDEMKQLFHWERLSSELRVINCHFELRQADGTLKNVTIYCKMARGAMARLIVKNKVTDPEELKDLMPEGFCYSAHESTPNDWHFVLEPA